MNLEEAARALAHIAERQKMAKTREEKKFLAAWKEAVLEWKKTAEKS